MLITLSGITGPLHGLCGVYQEHHNQESKVAVYKFLGVFDGFADWILYFCANHNNWVIGRQIDFPSGRCWICSASLTEGADTCQSPCRCTHWKVFNGSTWEVQQQVKIEPLQYVSV